MKEKYLAIPSYLLNYFVSEYPHLFLFREGNYQPFNWGERELYSDNLFFLPEHSRHDFVTELVKGVNSTILRDTQRSFRKECRTLHDIYCFMVMQLRDYRLDPTCQKLAMLNSTIAIELGKRELPISQLVQYLLQLKQQNYDLFFLHSCLIGFVCQRVLQQMGIEYHIFNETVIYTAYFHDIMLSINFDDMAPYLVHREGEEIEGRVEGGGHKGLEERQKIIRQHAKDAAAFVKEAHIIPEECIKIIRQHHGMLSGIGFSNQIHGRFSLLTSMFIMVDDFSGRHFNEISSVPKVDISSEIFASLYKTYHQKNFQEVLSILRKLL